MNVLKEKTPLRDVLYEFSLASETPDATLLEEFVQKYPEYARELTDFAVELTMDAAAGPDTALTEASKDQVSPAVSRAMSRFENKLFEVKQSRASQGSTPLNTSDIGNPFASLDRNAFRALATRVHANSLFISRLRDREIDVNTMSDGFKQRIANELDVPVEIVAAHFSAETQISKRQFFKSEEKPQVGGKIKFEDAVKNSGLTEDQQNYLRSL